MKTFDFNEYKVLKASNIRYIVKVDPMIENEGIHDIYLFKATDMQSVKAIKNIFGDITVNRIKSSDDILVEMASGAVYGINFLIA